MSEKTRGASRDLDKVIVRLPDGMREQLARAARVNGRSTNAEIVARLDRTLMRDEARGIVDTVRASAGMLHGLAIYLGHPEIQAAFRRIPELEHLAQAAPSLADMRAAERRGEAFDREQRQKGAEVTGGRRRKPGAAGGKKP